MDFDKILLNFSDSSADLRKVSARLLCELLHNSPRNVSKFALLREMGLDDGVIVLNAFPEEMTRDPLKLRKVVELLKAQEGKFRLGDNSFLCWYIGIEDCSNLTLLYRRNLPSTKSFIDPKFNLIGIFASKAPSRTVKHASLREDKALLQARPTVNPRRDYDPNRTFATGFDHKDDKLNRSHYQRKDAPKDPKHSLFLATNPNKTYRAGTQY